MTTVYRFYDSQDQLLYVGITSRDRQRIREHSSCKEWWPEVARSVFDHYETREEALRVEADVIQQEIPKYNIHPGHRPPEIWNGRRFILYFGGPSHGRAEITEDGYEVPEVVWTWHVSHFNHKVDDWRDARYRLLSNEGRQVTYIFEDWGGWGEECLTQTSTTQPSQIPKVSQSPSGRQDT